MRAKSRHPENDDFVEALIQSLEKRSRSIKHRGALLKWSRVKEIENGIESAIGRVDVDISYRIERARIQLRIIAWGDRWIWIDVRRGSKSGWVWAATLEGRFLDEDGTRGIVRKIEETIDATGSSTDDIPQLIAAVWATSLAKGPRRL